MNKFLVYESTEYSKLFIKNMYLVNSPMFDLYRKLFYYSDRL